MMKRVDSLLMVAVATIYLLSGAPWGAARASERPGAACGEEILIVYLSRTSNTKAIAEITYQKVGGTLVWFELETPYPADYRTTVQQVVRENDAGHSPPLKTQIERMEQYDFVFLGFPTWGCNCHHRLRAFCGNRT